MLTLSDPHEFSLAFLSSVARAWENARTSTPPSKLVGKYFPSMQLTSFEGHAGVTISHTTT